MQLWLGDLPYLITTNRLNSNLGETDLIKNGDKKIVHRQLIHHKGDKQYSHRDLVSSKVKKIDNSVLP